MQALRDYLTAGDKTRYDQLPKVRGRPQFAFHISRSLVV